MKIIIILLSLFFVSCEKSTISFSQKPKVNPDEILQDNDVKKLMMHDLEINPPALAFGNFEPNQGIVSKTVIITNKSTTKGKFQINNNLLKFNIDPKSSCLSLKGFKVLNPNASCSLNVLLDTTMLNGVVNENITLKDLDNESNLIIGLINVYGTVNKTINNDISPKLCKLNQHIENRKCVSNVRGCSNSTENQIWSNGSWSECTTGYILSASKDLNTGIILDDNDISKFYCDENCETQNIKYDTNSNIKLRAIPKLGYKISKWNGCDLISEDGQFCNIVHFDSNKNIQVIFEPLILKLETLYSNPLLASKIQNLNIQKNGIDCVDACLNNLMIGDNILISLTHDQNISIDEFEINGYVDNVLKNNDSISFRIKNSNVQVVINLAVNNDVSDPIIIIPDGETIIDQPIVDESNANGRTIRCTLPEDSIRLFSAESRLNIPHIIVSKNSDHQIDIDNFMNNPPSYYGWIYQEDTDSIRECYDFSLTPSEASSFIPESLPIEEAKSVRCYNAAGEKHLSLNIYKKDSIKSKIMSQASPIEVDQYNVLYRKYFYKGWIEDQGELKKCYEFSGELFPVSNSGDNLFVKAQDIIGDILEGSVSVLGDLGDVIINNTPNSREVINALNDVIEKINIDFPELPKVPVKPIIKGVSRGAENLGEVLLEQIRDISIGKPDYKAIYETIKQIRIDGDGVGNDLETVYKKIEQAVPNVNTKDLINALKEMELKIVEPGDFQEELMVAGNNLGNAVMDVAEHIPAIVRDFPKVKIDPPSISFNSCTLIPKCSWKWSYSCSWSWRKGLRCHGSNHLSCTYKNSCFSELPSLPAISANGLAKDLKTAIIDVGNGVEGALPRLVEVIQVIAREGDDVGNSLEDLVRELVPEGECYSLESCALGEAILKIGENARTSFSDLGEILGDIDIDVDLKLGSDLKNAIDVIKESGGNALEDTVRKIGYELPKALIITAKPVNKVLEEIKNIDFGDNDDPITESENFYVYGGKYYNKINVLIKTPYNYESFKEIKIFKNGNVCNEDCQQKILYGDNLVVQLLPKENVQIKSISAIGATVKNAGLNNYNAIMLKAKGNDIEVSVSLLERPFLTDPIITFINTETYFNNIKTSENFASFYITNSQGANEILISPSSDCSIGMYEPYSPFKSVSINQPNVFQPLSIKLRNGTKVSRCLNYKLYHDNIDTINTSPFTLAPTNQCILFGDCTPGTLQISYSNPTIVIDENVVHSLKIDGVLCDTFCQQSIPINTKIALLVEFNKYVKLNNVYQNGNLLSFDNLNVNKRVIVSGIYTAINDIMIDIEYKDVIANINDIQINGVKSNNKYYVSNNTVDFLINNELAREIAISSGGECINNVFQPNENLSLNVSNDVETTFSFLFKNGTKISNCISVNILKDSISPTLTSNFSTVNTNNSTITISGVCESNLPVLISDGIENNSVDCVNGNYSYAYNTIGKNEGSLSIQVSQKDLSNNISSNNTIINIDKSVPLITALGSSNKTAGESIILSGTCENGLPMSIYDNNTLLLQNVSCDGNYSVEVTPISNIGNNVFKIEQIDLANNKGSVLVNYEKVSSTKSCSVDNGTGINQWDSINKIYGSLCIVQTCNDEYSLGDNICVPTNYHIFVIAGGRNMTGINAQEIDINKTCNDPDRDSRILQYSRGVNIGGFCPYSAGVSGSFIPAINPLQNNGASGLVYTDKVIVSSPLRFAKRYLPNIPATDKILLLPVANTDFRFFAGTASFLPSAIWNIDTQAIINNVINKLGSRALFKGILYHGHESEYLSYDSSIATGEIAANYLNNLKTYIPNSTNLPIIVGSLCKNLLNTPNALITNNRLIAINQYIPYVQYVSGTDLNCIATDFTQPNMLIMGDRYYDAIMSNNFYPTRIQSPITAISLSRNKNIINQSSMGVGKIIVSGGTPPYSFTTNTAGFSIINDTLLATNTVLGSNIVNISVLDSNGVSFNQDISVQGVNPTYTTKSFKTTGDVTFATTQSSVASYLDFESSWSLSFKVYINDNLENGAAYQVFSTINDLSTTQQGVALFIENRKLKIRYQQDMTVPYLISGNYRYGNFFISESYDQLAKNEWHHITITYDHTISTRGSRVLMYVNGSRINASIYDHATNKNTISVNNSNNVLFFRAESGQYGFKMPIDDIAFFNTRLVPVEITELYTEGDLATHTKFSNIKHMYRMENSSDSNTIFDNVMTPHNPINLTKILNSSFNGSYIDYVPAF